MRARCLPVLALLISTSSAFAQEAADVILSGGKISTVDAKNTQAEAIAIKGDQIVAVGTASEIAKWRAPATKVIELDGRRVTPGFIESHGHLTGMGEAMLRVDLSTATSWEEVVAKIDNAARSAPEGEWIVGTGWHQSKWKSPPADNVEGYPVTTDLDKVTPKHPVIMRHASGHMLFANSKAMEAGKVDANTKPPPGGEILRFKDGKPTGAFRETAAGLVDPAFSKWRASRPAEVRRSELLRSLDLATKECLKQGITTFGDAGSSLSTVSLYKSLIDEGRMPIRLWVMLNESNAALSQKLEGAKVLGYGDSRLTVRGIKRMADGALGTHGALLLGPYDDQPMKTGLAVQSMTYIEEAAKLAAQHGFQLCVHAIGDKANRDLLDMFERVQKEMVPGKDLRWRIEHAQHLDTADIPRFKKLGVIASMQANHCTSDAPYVVQRLGMRRAQQGAYAWRSLLDSGAIIVNGTDVPVEKVDPIACYYSSVTRKMADGVAFFPEQCMTREEALKSYTRDAAYAQFEDSNRGSLEVGKLADLVVLSDDILTIADHKIKDVKVDLTMVGGKVLYERANEEASR
jgi:predicted amidohydrolase YtcJ